MYLQIGVSHKQSEMTEIFLVLASRCSFKVWQNRWTKFGFPAFYKMLEGWKTLVLYFVVSLDRCCQEGNSSRGQTPICSWKRPGSFLVPYYKPSLQEDWCNNPDWFWMYNRLWLSSAINTANICQHNPLNIEGYIKLR